MHTVTVSSSVALVVAPALVVASAWFAVEPMPEDLFEITVKADAKTLLDKLVASAS